MSSSSEPSAEDFEKLPCPPHPPIRVEGDEEFLLPGSGVVGGLGIAQLPFVIALWCIDGTDDRWDELGVGPDQDHGIVLKDTDAHVLVLGTNTTAHERHGVLLDGANNVTLKANTITDNGGDGVRMLDAQQNALLNNRIEGQGVDGVFLWKNAPDNRIEGNTIKDNGLFGVNLRTSVGGNELVDNLIEGNDRSGIHSSSSDENSVVQNTIRDNGNDGLRLEFGGNHHEISQNQIFENGRNGIRLAGAGNHNVHNNTIRDNDRRAILLRGPPPNNAIHGNILAQSNWGIDVIGGDFGTPAGNQYWGNNFQDNDEGGFRASSTNYHGWFGSPDPNHIEDNWWGHETGPGGGVDDDCSSEIADGDGQRIVTDDARVCFEPWLQAPNLDAGAG